MLKIAQKRGIKTFSGYGEKLPFNDEEFDFVAIIITICFIRNPEKVINEAKRVLKIGGKLIIGIIDKNSPLGQFYLEKKKQGHLFYKYANFYSVDEIVKMLEKYGFGNFKLYQTIFKSIEEIKEAEMPKEGYGEGSFVVISAERL
jgi:ubiquinone/menaquinone biosynthesis C-methylase UbiE